MYYVAEAVYTVPLPCSPSELAEELMPDHTAHIRSGVEAGLVLLAGPKGEGDGGFVILRADSRGELDAFLGQDPLVLRGVQTFRVTPWKIFDYPAAAEALLGCAGESMPPAQR